MRLVRLGLRRLGLRRLGLRRLGLSLLGLSLLAAGCDDAKQLAIEITSGQEAGAFGRDPAVVNVEVRAVEAGGELTLNVSAAPGEDFELGELPDTSIVTFELTGKAADGSVVMRGRSVSVAIGAIDGTTLPLFMQRLGELARPAGELSRSHVFAPAGVLAERFLISTGGERAAGASGPANAALADYYDQLLHVGSESGAPLPRVAKSLVVLGTRLFLFDETGGSFADLQTGQSGELTAPDGFTFAEISSGRAILRPDGSTLVIGATRSAEASNAILIVGADGSLSGVRLATSRSGAAATYVEGVGVVVLGGSDQGAGGEVVSDANAVTPLPFAPDPVSGAGAVSLGEQRLALLGGIDSSLAAAPGRVLDLRCAANCVPDSIPELALPEVVSHGVAFAAPSHVLVVGESPTTGTTLHRVSLGDATKILVPMREPRQGATAVAAPNGTLAILGGETGAGAPVRSVEFYFPF